MQGQLQRHRQPLDSSFEILAEPPPLLEGYQIPSAAGLLSPDFVRATFASNNNNTPFEHPIERDASNQSDSLLSQHFP